MANDFSSGCKTFRAVGTLGLGLLLLCVPITLRAANNCPWMNEATASGLLGGTSVGAYSVSAPNQPAVCMFTQSTADVTRTLKITIEVSGDDPHARMLTLETACESNSSPIKAIGNEAITCAVEERPTSRAVRVIGRVRDQVFEILITTTRTDDPILTRDALRIRINTAAEQVSGNLF